MEDLKVKVNISACKLDERKATVALEVQNFEDVKRYVAEKLEDEIKDGIVEIRDDEIIYRRDGHTVYPIIKRVEEFMGDTWFDLSIVAPLLRIYLLKTCGFKALLNYIFGGRLSFIKCIPDEHNQCDVFKFKGHSLRNPWAYIKVMTPNDIVLWIQNSFLNISVLIDSVKDENIPDCAEDELIIE